MLPQLVLFFDCSDDDDNGTYRHRVLGLPLPSGVYLAVVSAVAV